MKRILILLVLCGTIVSCTKDECTELKTGVFTGKSIEGKSDKVTLCHNGSTIEVSQNAVQSHLNHGDILGECETLSNGPISGAIQREVPCGSTSFTVNGVEYIIID